MALAQGTQAGLQAQRGPQGPAEAARIAAAMPQKRLEQAMANKHALSSQKLDDLNVAMTQIKLHQLQMVAAKMEDDQANAVYDKGRDTMDALLEKGKVDVLATGDFASVTSEFNKKQVDAKRSGQGLLPLQILPAPGSSAKDPKYALVMVGKDRLTEDWDETDTPASLGYDPEEAKKAGLGNFKFHAPLGMDQQKALQLRVSQYAKWVTDSENGMRKWQATQAGIAARGAEGQKNRDLRLKIAEMNTLQRENDRAIKDAQSRNNKEELQILNERKTHIDKLAEIQKTTGVAAWADIGGGKQRAITTERRAIADTEKRLADLRAKQAGAPANITPGTTNLFPKVPKGTPITPQIVQQYKVRAGGDAARARQMAIDDGYDPKSFVRKPAGQGQ
jgi:hypothetical protein